MKISKFIFGKKFLLLVAVTLSLTAFSAIIVFNRLCISAAAGRVFHSTADVPANDVALVLGTSKKTPSGAANLHFTQRINAAAALYHSGKVTRVLVSGDNHIAGYDEPSDMRAALAELGVPTNAVVCDYAGFRTLDSVVRAKTVFGLSHVTIVTEEFHCPRALWIASRHGLDAIAFAAPDLKSLRWSMRVKARECLARVYCGVDLYVLHRSPKFSGPKEFILVSAND